MSEQSKAPDVIWACAGAISSGVEVWEWGIAYEDFEEWSDETDFTPVEFVSRDHCNALVGAAYEAVTKAVDHHLMVRTNLAVGDVVDTKEAIYELTPADAQAAYDAALSAARAEGYAKALEDAASNPPFYVVEMPLTDDGNGPATIGKDAAKMTYEIWEAQTFRSIASFELLSDANRAWLRALKEQPND